MAQPSTPRDVRAGIYDVAEGRAYVAHANGTLQPAGDASVKITLVHSRWNKFQSKSTDLAIVPTTPTGHFHFEAQGRTSDGAVEAVQLFVTSQGREPVSRQIPASPGDPVEVRVITVLDEAHP